MLSAIFYFILFIGVIVFILISMGVLLVGSKANEYHNGTAYNKARRTVENMRGKPLTKQDRDELLEWSRRNL